MATKRSKDRVVGRLVARAGTPSLIEIEGLTEVADRIGRDLLAAFLKCFEGIDRLLSLEDLLVLNNKLEPSSPIRYTRNLRLLVRSLGATMYEVAEALQELCWARVVEKMTDRDLWDPVNELRGRWRGDPRLASLRNELGFHLGKIELYRTGLLKLLDVGEDHVFAKRDGDLRHEGEFSIASECLTVGHGMSLDDHREITDMTWEAHSELPDQLFLVWVDVLKTAGIEVTDESQVP
jgi:hypothetical protein